LKAASFPILNGDVTSAGGTLTTSVTKILGNTVPANAAGALINNGTGTLSWTSVPTGSGTVSGTNTGDQTITLTGDVTGSGTGSFATAIGAGRVTNTMLAGSIAATKLLVNADFAFTANQSISNSAPSFVLMDTTASAKSLTIVV